jgi:hypothetical protein
MAIHCRAAKNILRGITTILIILGTVQDDSALRQSLGFSMVSRALYVAPAIREISEHLRSGRAMKNVLNFPASGAPRNRDASSGATQESFKKGVLFSSSKCIDGFRQLLFWGLWS